MLEVGGAVVVDGPFPRHELPTSNIQCPTSQSPHQRQRILQHLHQRLQELRARRAIDHAGPARSFVERIAIIARAGLHPATQLRAGEGDRVDEFQAELLRKPLRKGPKAMRTIAKST